MVAKLFTDILAKGVRAGHAPGKTQAARDWYRTTAKNSGKVNERKLVTDSKDNYKSRATIGDMFMYYYDPKGKKTLPYYDRFPLIFAVKPAKGGFYGINMHYLPPELRAKLMDAFHGITSNNNYSNTTKLQMTYEVLQGAAKFRWFKPAFKHYLTSHVRSKLVKIDAADWDTALFLPTARFVGAGKSKVWADSRKIIRG